MKEKGAGQPRAGKFRMSTFLFLLLFFLEAVVSRLLVHPLADHFLSEVFSQVKHERWHHVFPGIRISNGRTDASLR